MLVPRRVRVDTIKDGTVSTESGMKLWRSQSESKGQCKIWKELYSQLSAVLEKWTAGTTWKWGGAGNGDSYWKSHHFLVVDVNFLGVYIKFLPITWHTWWHTWFTHFHAKKNSIQILDQFLSLQKSSQKKMGIFEGPRKPKTHAPYAMAPSCPRPAFGCPLLCCSPSPQQKNTQIHESSHLRWFQLTFLLRNMSCENR